MNNFKTIISIDSLKKWFPILWFLVFVFLFYFTFKSNEAICFGCDCIGFKKENWDLFIDIFKVPLAFLGFGIALYTIIVTLYRSEQFNENLREIRNQKFDVLFFNLLKVHQEIVNSIDLIPGVSNRPLITGRDCFRTFYKDFDTNYNGNVKAKKETGQKRIEIAFDEFYREKQSDLGHYFRHFKGMVEYIDKSSINNKKFYTEIIRNQLSIYELLILFYYGLSGQDPRLKPLLEKYNMFHYLPAKRLYSIIDVNLYKQEAFGEEIRDTF